jgi:hypothetical protein
MFSEEVLAESPHKLSCLVDDDFGDAYDVVFEGKVREFAAIDNLGFDEVGFHGKLMGDGCGNGAMRTSKAHKHLDVHGHQYVFEDGFGFLGKVCFAL